MTLRTEWGSSKTKRTAPRGGAVQETLRGPTRPKRQDEARHLVRCRLRDKPSVRVERCGAVSFRSSCTGKKTKGSRGRMWGRTNTRVWKKNRTRGAPPCSGNGKHRLVSVREGSYRPIHVTYIGKSNRSQEERKKKKSADHVRCQGPRWPEGGPKRGGRQEWDEREVSSENVQHVVLWDAENEGIGTSLPGVEKSAQSSTGNQTLVRQKHTTEKKESLKGDRLRLAHQKV